MTDNALVILDAREQADLATCEEVIDQGLRTFVEVGTALLTIRDKRLYRAQYGTFEDYCQERWGMARRTTNRLIAAAGVVTNLRMEESSQMGPIGPILPATESQARPLTQLPPDVQPVIWQRAVETAPGGKMTAAHVQAVVDALMEKPAKEWYQSSESEDWWTPQWLFDLLHSELGFETDVCASEANHKCPRYFTREQDGLAQKWTGSCWMNPPYGRSGGSAPIGHWIEKAFRSALDGATVVCLVPARTDTKWWWEFCIHGEVRFLPGRLRFSDADNTATFPSAVVIFWPTVPREKTTVSWWNVGERSKNGSPT